MMVEGAEYCGTRALVRARKSCSLPFVLLGVATKLAITVDKSIEEIGQFLKATLEDIIIN